MISVGKLKQKIRDMAKEDNIPHEILYQNFFFERFLERLSISNYKDKMIIKGGFLLTSLLGIENRSTADIDFTINTLSMNENIVRSSINQIIEINVGDECNFEITNISEIRHDDKYEGLRATILGEFHGLRFHFKLDLSTGDQITPSPVNRLFKLNISDKCIELFSYNLETVLAEKLQTILSRGIATTRAKDYFDVYSIIANHKDLIDSSILKEAFNATMNYRETNYSKERIVEIMDSIKESNALIELWNAYKDEFFFAHNIEFESVYLAVKKVILEILN
jgi:predicted nucleotidyltransferase component of viral defense system